MTNNSIKINAGGDVNIKGAVGVDARSAHVNVVGEEAIKNIEHSFHNIRHELEKFLSNASITPKQSILLEEELSEIETLTKSEYVTEDTFQKKATNICEKINFACESAGSVSLIAKYLVLIGSSLGFKISGLI